MLRKIVIGAGAVFVLAASVVGPVASATSGTSAPAVSTASSTPAAAQSLPALGESSTLSDYITYALARNPGLHAYADQSDAAHRMASQVRALPDPMLSFGVFTSTPETRVGPQEFSLGLSQRLPFFGKRSLRGQIAERQADGWQQAYEQQALDVTRDVTVAYYELYRIQHVLAVTKSEKDVIAQMQNIAQIKYASGRVGQQDVLKAQLALSNIDSRLLTLESERVSAAATLNTLLGREPDAALAVAVFPEQVTVPPSAEELYATALATRPEAASAATDIARFEQAGALARREYFPDLTLGVNYISVDKRPMPAIEDNGKDVVQVTASINLPIWYGRLRSAVAESDARVEMARNRKRDVELRILGEIRASHARATATAEQVNLYDTVIIPQAEQAFYASETGYQTGTVDFLNYLDSERVLLSHRQTYFTLQADLGKQMAALERALGSSVTGADKPQE